MTAPAPSRRSNRALAEIPPERFAGAVFITDGQVHDVPADLAKARRRGAAPRAHHRLARPRSTAASSSTSRRASASSARSRRSASMSRKPMAIGRPVERRRPPRQWRDRRISRLQPGRALEVPVTVDHGGQNIAEIVAAPLEGEISGAEQPRHRRHRRHPRPPARAAGFGRAASGRAHLAQPSEGRRLGRSRAFHHPAPAREAGRHADQGAVADRLPDARAVRRQARRIRSHHLRPLSAARRAAAGLSRQCRRLCEARRRGADRRRARLRRRGRPLQHAAGRGHLRPLPPARSSKAASSRRSPSAASAIR